MKQVHFGLSKAPVFSKGAPNERATLQQLVHTLQRKNTSIQPPQRYNELPELVRRSNAGDKDAGRQYKAIKDALPYFIPGGYCQAGHSNAALEFNGVVQVDIDLKHLNGDTEALALLDIVKQIQPESALLAAISPSGHGLKILCQTDCEDKTRYKEAELVVLQHYAELLKIPLGRIDPISASQACYLPFERPGAPIYVNEEAQALHIPLKPKSQRPTEPAGDCPHDLALAACEHLLHAGTNVATRYDEYIKVVAACKNAFGEAGEQICFDLLNNSPQFINSDFSKKFQQKYRRDIKERVNGRRATGWYLVSLAAKAGLQSYYTAKNTTRLRSEPGEKMLDTLIRCGATHLVFGAFITAPTGHGKTTAICKLVEIYPDRKIILVVPTTAILEQAKHDHPGAAVFYGRSKKLPNDARLIVTTGASFMNLCGVINPAEYDVFLDEAHQLAADSNRGYRLNQMREFIEMRQQCRTVSYMTGTPLYLDSPIFKDVPRLEIIQPGILVPRSVFFYTTEKTLFLAAETAKRSADKGRRAIILINDKTLKLDTLKSLLKERNLAILNADTKETTVFKQITQQGEIPKETRCIITTSVITTGNSIYDSSEFDIILVGAFHSSTISQISARPRNAKQVNIHVIRSANRKAPAGKGFNRVGLTNRLRETAQRACDELNNQPNEHDLADVRYHELQLRKHTQNDPIKQDTNGRWQVCELELMNMVYQSETLVESANDELLANNLKRYGINVAMEARREYGAELAEYIPAYKIAPTEAEQEEAERYRSDQKEARRLEYQSKLTELEQAIAPDAVINSARDTGKVPKAFKWAQVLVGTFRLSYPDAIQALRQVDNSGKAFSLLCKRLSAASLEANTEYMDSNTMQGIMIKALRSALPYGTKAPINEIRLALIDVLALDKSIRLEEWQPAEPDKPQEANRKALAFLNMFYNARRSKRPGKHAARQRKSVYILENVSSCIDAPTPKIPPTTCEKTLAEYITPAPPSYDSRPLPVTSETCPF